MSYRKTHRQSVTCPTCSGGGAVTPDMDKVRRRRPIELARAMHTITNFNHLVSARTKVCPTCNGAGTITPRR